MRFQKHPQPGKPLFLAPIATLTHEPFRQMVESFGGVQGYFTEMVSAEALTNGGVYEQYFLKAGPDPTRIHIQLIGYSRPTLVLAAKRILETDFSGVDINLGCGAPHIRRKGGGSAWLEENRQLPELLHELREILGEKALSAKIRIPEELTQEGWERFLLELEASGLDFLTIHPRQPKDKFSGILDWNRVEFAAELLRIPVIGNGGIHTIDDYLRAQNSKVDGLMIGRSAARAPWIFSYFKARESGQPFPLLDLRSLGKQFLENMENGQPSEFWLTRAKRFFHYFAKNLAFGHHLYSPIQNERDYQRLKSRVLEYLENSKEALQFQEKA